MKPVKKYAISDYNINITEAFRYMGASGEVDADLLSLAEDISSELLKTCRPLACYIETAVKKDGDLLNFGFAEVKSATLKRNLAGCKRAILFAATLGVDFDRLLNLRQITSPAKAVILDAVGSAAIEGVCDALEDIIKKELLCKLKPRFSPGYGDFDISFQKNIIDELKTKQNIGLTVSDSLMLLPTKSVTAIIGLE